MRVKEVIVMDKINLCKMFDAAIKDEADAVKMYGNMSNLLKINTKGPLSEITGCVGDMIKKEDDSFIIAVDSIAKDEQKHHDMLIKIKSHLC